MKKLQAATLLASLVATGGAFAQAKAPAPDWTISGNVTLASDYRFRGFTQTDYAPTFQGGFDVAHKSGFYLGNWNSNVLNSLFTGASLEMDFYGGYKFDVAGVGLDIGAIHYYYPRSGTAGPNTKIDNSEVYLGASYGPLSAKVYYAVSDYFDVSKFVVGAPSTKGTMYYDLAGNFDLGGGFTLGAHVGLLRLKNAGFYTDILGNTLSRNVTDYKVSLTKDVGGFAVTGAYITASKKNYFGTGQLAPAEGAGKGRFVVSVGKTF